MVSIDWKVLFKIFIEKRHVFYSIEIYFGYLFQKKTIF